MDLGTSLVTSLVTSRGRDARRKDKCFTTGLRCSHAVNSLSSLSSIFSDLVRILGSICGGFGMKFLATGLNSC
jgi:hypothetical protein